MKKCFFLLAISVLCSGCITQQDWDSMQNRVYSQQQETRAQKEKIKQLEEELSRTSGQLQQEISKSGTPLRTTQANLWAEIESQRVRLATLQGQVDELLKSGQGRSLSSEKMTADISDLMTRMERVENELQTTVSQLGVDLSETVGQDKTQSATPSASAPAPPRDTGGALYKRALETFYAKKYAEAQSMWAEFIKLNPKDSLVPNALFWQGEAHYQQQDYPRAVLSYQEVISRFPKSGKYRPSLLKQGISFHKMDKKQAGNLVLKTLIDKFPASPEARRAKTFLD
ncbi:MAG TPA: tol-pal system protein YbgF [Desulfomicrobiaceae bacterium]|nr:tol-pal system protein YbgF [Desulfomicrobiaceae bacterium]